MTDLNIFRVYPATDAGPDGYPYPWHYLAGPLPGIKDIVREQAGNRCERCGHPYAKGMGEWSPCDEQCTHVAPDSGVVRIRDIDGELPTAYVGDDGERYEARLVCESFHIETTAVEAQWRVLTVHHLNGDKLDCRWWNLCALDQRCHLAIQGKVLMGRVWPWQHTPWFEIHAAGFYASVYLGEELTRAETEARLDELLALERAA